MKDYQKTKIYFIEVNGLRYYGHTTYERLSQRKAKHVDAFSQSREKNRKVYKAIRDAGLCMKDMELKWVEDFPCDNVDQAKARERWWIEQQGKLNSNIPTRTKCEWYKHNRERLSAKNKVNRENKRGWYLRYNKEYYEKNRGKIAEKTRLSYVKNKNKRMKYHKEWRKKNAEKQQAKSKEYYDNNKEVILQKSKLYRQANKVKESENKKDYYEKNKEKILARNAEKIPCETCGFHITRNHMKRHCRSKHPE